MNKNKQKILNLKVKINVIKTKKPENLSEQIITERFCMNKSQVNLKVKNEYY